MDRRDRFEELFRKRLHDWECEPDSEQWKTIFDFLPLRHTRFSARSIRRIAATLTLLLLIGGGFLYHHFVPETTTVQSRNGIESSDMGQIEIPRLNGLPTGKTTDSIHSIPTRKPTITPLKVISTAEHKNSDTLISLIAMASQPLKSNFSPVLITKHTKAGSVKKQENIRKWHLGMGGGNFNVTGISTGSADHSDYFYNDYLEGNPSKPPLSKAGTSPISTHSRLSDLKPDKVKHSSPVSFGISISRMLSERWSFNTGLTYSYLRNRWRYENTNNDVLHQRLHMLGIPVSFSYRLTHWERFYWSSGVTCEMNLTGKLYSSHKSQRQRIRGTLWTANTRIGVAYPIIRHISVYAEGGFLWNLTPKSEIQTIRSEHFFNLSGQIGFRLNF